MSEERDSVTALVFHCLGGLAGAVTLVCMASKVMAVGPGMASLMSALVLWWMGDVVSLLKAISYDLRHRPNESPSTVPPKTASQSLAPSSKPAAPKPDAAVYKLD